MSDALCVGDHGDAPTQADVGYLCVRCFSRLRNSLLQLPAVATWLEVNIAATGNPNGERVSGSSEDPIPLRPDVLDLVGPDSRKYAIPDPNHLPLFLLWEDGLIIGYYGTWQEAQVARVDEMRLAGVEEPVIAAVVHPDVESTEPPEKVAAARERWQVRPVERGGIDQRGEDSFHNTLITWAKLVATEGPFAWTDRNDTTGLVAWLSGHLSWIAGQPWVDEFAADIRKLSSDAHRVAPWRPEHRRLDDPCTACGVRAVVAHIGEGHRQCEKRAGGCGKREKLSEYELRVLLPESRRAS